MKQQLSDLLLLLRKDRKTQIAAGLVGLLVIAFLMTPAPPQNGGGGGNQIMTELGTGAMGTDDSYRDIMSTITQDIKHIQGDIQSIREDADQRTEEFNQYERRTATIFEKILERMAELEISGGTGTASSVGADGDLALGVDGLGDENIDGLPIGELADDELELEPFGNLEAQAPLPPAIPQRSKVAFIGPGDVVRVKLLAGVHAPTNGNPYPVVLKVVGDVTGPDGSKLPLGEARIVAAAQGSLSDGRALFRLSELSMRLPDGQRRVLKVDGWLVGEDGIRGLPGKLIDHLDTIVPAVSVLGAAGAASKAFGSTQFSQAVNDDGGITSVFTGSTTEAAAAGAASGAIDKIQEVIADRIDQLVPHVEILSGREATAVFAQSVVVDSLFETLEDDNFVFTSLD